MSGHCLLCAIARGHAGVPLLYEDELAAAFDVPEGHPNKRAPVHVLVVPKEHIPSARKLEPRHEPMLGRLVTTAARCAKEKGIDQSGYRLISSTGEDANQTVLHLHLHCLGGKKLPETS